MKETYFAANMNPEIITIPEKKLIGMHITVTPENNPTVELWRKFMPRRREITNAVGAEVVSMQIFDPSTQFGAMQQLPTFENWAAVEVADFSAVPDGMETYTLAGGKYVTFLHIGTDAKYFENLGYMFTEWLPANGLTVDSREHFELLGERYKVNDPTSEEEVWIPVK